MGAKPTFSDVLDAAETLDMDAQEQLISVLRRRLAERGRERIVRAAEDGRREYEAGNCPVMTPDEITREARGYLRGMDTTIVREEDRF